MIGVPERHATLLDHLYEGLYHPGIELAAGDTAQLRERRLRADGTAVRITRRHHVVGVGSGDDAGAERHLLDRHLVVAVAVVALVVAVDDVRDRAVAVDPADELRSLLG